MKEVMESGTIGKNNRDMQKLCKLVQANKNSRNPTTIKKACERLNVPRAVYYRQVNHYYTYKSQYNDFSIGLFKEKKSENEEEKGNYQYLN